MIRKEELVKLSSEAVLFKVYGETYTKVETYANDVLSPLMIHAVLEGRTYIRVDSHTLTNTELECLRLYLISNGFSYNRIKIDNEYFIISWPLPEAIEGARRQLALNKIKD